MARISQPLFLETPRLSLRFHDDTDAAFMMELNADPAVTRFTGDGPVPDLAEARERLARLAVERESRLGRMVVLDRGSGERLGWCGLKYLEEAREVDLGYRFLARHWGKGYATEASRASLAFGFDELRLERVIAHVAAGNIASMRVLDKLGFSRTGPGTEAGMAVMGFAMTREAHEAQRAR